MYWSTEKYIKIFFSIILIVFAYHYFSLGSTNISNISNKKDVVKINQIEKIIPDVIEKDVPKIIQKDIVIESEKELNKKLDSELQTIPKTKEDVYLKLDEIVVQKNQTFGSILKKQEINEIDRQDIISTTQKIFDLKKLGIGQRIIFYYNEENTVNNLLKITLPINFKEEIVIEKIDNKFIAKKISLPIISETRVFNVKIKNSIFSDGVNAEIPTSVLIDLIRLYSFDIDFQRDIRVNDEFTILYEIYLDENKREVAYGDILYSNLMLQEKDLEYFLFVSEGFKDYFNREGKNVRKALMKTPIDGARISSGFGMRKHPILGYNVKHKGLDFAAPRGTPVFAAGNGVVEYAGRKGAYGKYIRIRHNNSYKTAYAHLNGFKKGIGKSVRVSQGDVIGYVGSTGRSTGPHLHYEVLFNNKQINPMKMKLPSGKTLKGDELIEFKEKSNILYNVLLNKLNN